MNSWASTTPYRTTTAVEDISDRAFGYNMPREIVNGNDVFEVYAAAVRAVERARKGEGPTFIEAKTYRIEGHFVGDPEMYRKKEETKKILEDNDPITRFEERVVKAKLMTQKECDKIRTAAIEKVAKAKEYAMSCEYPDPSEFYKDVYVD